MSVTVKLITFAVPCYNSTTAFKPCYGEASGDRLTALPIYCVLHFSWTQHRPCDSSAKRRPRRGARNFGSNPGTYYKVVDSDDSAIWHSLRRVPRAESDTAETARTLGWMSMWRITLAMTRNYKNALRRDTFFGRTVVRHFCYLSHRTASVSIGMQFQSTLFHRVDRFFVMMLLYRSKTTHGRAIVIIGRQDHRASTRRWSKGPLADPGHDDDNA